MTALRIFADLRPVKHFLQFFGTDLTILNHLDLPLFDRAKNPGFLTVVSLQTMRYEQNAKKAKHLGNA